MARLASASRLARVLAIVPWVLQHPQEATVDAVCARFGIDEATLMDDLNLLFMCGLPPFAPGDLIEAGVEGDHVVIRMADYLARPLRLTRWEAVSLLAAAKALASMKGLPEAPALRSAIGKISGAIAPGEAEAANVLAERVAIDLEPPPPGLLEDLRDAIEQRHTITIEYYSFGRDEIGSRQIDPLLVFGARPWYLVAHDHKSGERRNFRVDRIRSCEATGAVFERPSTFDASHAAGEPLYHPSPDDVVVVIDLAPGAAWVAEVTPHDAAEDRPGGGTRITLHAGQTAWLEHLLLMLGNRARVVSPPELAERVRERALAALARYQPPQA